MCSARGNVALPTLGFPIREPPGQWLFSASPGLIAAVHALHRLLVPRHPPHALTILTVILGRALRLRPVIPVSLATVQFSRSGRGATRRRASGLTSTSLGTYIPERRRRAGLSKLNSMRAASAGRTRACGLPGPVDIARAIARGDRCPNGLPRKEVIQPQLPLRLPCYDFTPVASPTFDGSLPKGLGHRLRVLLTPMV